ncbi:beta-lactamase family protein [Nocardioides sp. W3-2-3]|nr:beta-lactamase family protein [Nocardioides convexus]
MHVANAPQHLPPGHLYSYCSAGMGVLGRLVEVTLGLSYDEALRRRLADPLGVRGLAVDAGEALAHRSAIGHVDARAGQPARPLRTWAQMPASNPAAGNSLAMPARGLVALARMHLGDGVGPGGARLLSRDSARLMRTAQVPVPASAGAQQGLGWRLPAPGVAEHGGDAIGCGAMLRTVPDAGVAVAVLVNGGQMSALISTLCAEPAGRRGRAASAPAGARWDGGRPGAVRRDVCAAQRGLRGHHRRRGTAVADPHRARRGRHDGDPRGCGARAGHPRPAPPGRRAVRAGRRQRRRRGPGGVRRGRAVPAQRAGRAPGLGLGQDLPHHVLAGQALETRRCRAPPGRPPRRRPAPRARRR